MTMKAQKFFCTLLVALTMGGLWPAPASARPVVYSLVRKTRGAQLIVIGRVAELRPASVVVESERQLKGATVAGRLEVPWDFQGTVEERPPALAVGAPVLLFAVRRGDTYETFGGGQGIVALEPSEAARYRWVVERLLNFDAASSPVAKQRLLIELLTGVEHVGQTAALEIIYQEYHTGAFLTAPLVQPVLALAKGADVRTAVPAIQVLGVIGNRSVIPVLIQLLRSPEPAVVEAAAGVLEDMTRAGIELTDPGSPAERARVATRWESWWRRNRNTAVIVR